MNTSKIAISAIFFLGVVFGILLGQLVSVNVTQAATVATSSPATGTYTADFVTESANVVRYVFRQYLPVGTTFDSMQIAYVNAPTNSGNVYFAIMDDNGTRFDICDDNSCTSNDSEIKSLGSYVHSSVNGNTYKYNFSTSSTITNTSQYLVWIFDPNSPKKIYSYFTSPSVSSENGSALQRTAGGGTAFALCSSFVCDSAQLDLSNVTTQTAENSFITITKPTPYGTTTSAGNVDVEAFYYYEGNFSTTTKAEIKIYDAVTNELQHEAFIIVPAYSSNINFNLPTTFNMATGSKRILARFVEISSNLDLIIQKESFFNVATNTYFINTGLISPISLPTDLSQIDCDTFDVGCQFQKALTFLFIPSQDTLDRFSNLWVELKYLKPFGYVTIIFEQLTGVTTSGVGAYTLPQVPFIDTIFTPFKTALSIMLWGVFGFVFYRRIKNIDI